MRAVMNLARNTGQYSDVVFSSKETISKYYNLKRVQHTGVFVKLYTASSVLWLACPLD